MFDHYHSLSYGAARIGTAYYRSSTVSIGNHNILDYTSTNGGAWSIALVDATTFRLTKTAGTYAGPGYGYILVRGAA